MHHLVVVKSFLLVQSLRGKSPVGACIHSITLIKLILSTQEPVH